MYRQFDDYQRARRARVASWLSQHGEAEIVTGICEGWVRDIVESGREPHSRHDLQELPTGLSLVARLSDAGHCTHSDALAWKINGSEGVEPTEAPLIGHALAVASGRVYVAYDPGKLHWIGLLVSTIDQQAWEAFADSAAAALRQDADRCRAFVEFLTAIVREANDTPDCIAEVPLQHASMASLVEQFVQNGSFQEVWQANSSPVFFRWSGDFEVLRRTQPELFLELIDELPHPALVAGCLIHLALIENAGEILRLLSLARASFDAEGHWQRHGMAAILLLQSAGIRLLNADTLQRHTGFTESPGCSARSQEAEKSKDIAKNISQFRDEVCKLLDVLFARPDGAELGWYWLEKLLCQLPQHQPWSVGHGPRKHMVDRIGTLVHAVSSRLAPRRLQGAWIADAEPLARQYRAVAVLSVVAFSGTAGDLDTGAVARDVLKGNDVKLTAAEEMLRLPGAPLRTIPGHALARIPDVASWFTQTWLALRFEREQAWRRALGRSGVDANPAEIVAIWGLGVVEALAADETRHNDACMMWQALEAAIREARLVEPRIGRDFWSSAVVHLFAWWPFLFLSVTKLVATSAESTSDASIVLSSVLAPYVGISNDFMGIIVSLHQAGLAAATLDRAVGEAGRDLLRMVRRFFETARSLENVRLWNQEWVAALRSIEAAIAAQRSGNEDVFARR